MEALARYENLAKYEGNGIVITRQGVIPGNRRKRQEEILGRKRLWSAQFPEGTFLKLDSNKLPINDDPYTDSAASTDFSAFQMPQLIVKQSWQASIGRFQAAVVKSDERTSQGIICSESCVSIHTSEGNIRILKAACLIYNSKIAVYYLFLSNGFFALYRPKVTVKDLLNVPIPSKEEVNLDSIKTSDGVDQFTNRLFALKDSEYTL
ncbi:MAG TPA: hypothetical protein V6C84_29390 [Coleofasciculaceae cyanobacterium]